MDANEITGIPEDLMSDFGLPTPGQKTDTEETFRPGDISQGGLDNRLEQLAKFNAQPQSTQPGAQQQQPAQQSQQAGAPVANAQQTQPQQQQAPVDPVKAFEDGAKKAFFAENGEPDAQKITDYFLTNGRSFLKLSGAQQPQQTEAVAPEPAKVDPKAEYTEKATWVADNFESIIEDQRKRGFDEAQAIQNVNAYLANLRAERDRKNELRDAIQAEAKQLAPEIEENRRNKQSAQIDRNVTEFAANLEGLIPGLTGAQALNHIILNPEYGGKLLDRMFMKEVPGVAKMDDGQRKEAAAKWFREFQCDREAMAHVAEFGRLKLQAMQTAALLQHAQLIGAGKVQNAAEAGRGKQSALTNTPGTVRGAGRVGEFLGIVDTVN